VKHALLAALKASRREDVTYWCGDRAVYTGTVVNLHGGLFYEIQLVEGHLAGEKKLVSKPPKGE
jgi:hypothetical protein